MHPVHIGCSGWNYRDWRGTFYPAGVPARRWLECYAEHFDTVEVNTTFYRLPRRDAVAHWVQQTPPSFQFAVKASRYLTHIRRLQNMADGVSRFYERIEPLIEGGRLGPVLWQLPANFRRDDTRLLEALEALPDGRHAFEFRDPSWFVPAVFALLREHRVALVFGDHPERPFQSDESTAEWAFIRLHYGHRGRIGNYSRTELQQWAQLLRRWRRSREIYFYLNNDWNAYAPRNAELLERFVNEG